MLTKPYKRKRKRQGNKRKKKRLSLQDKAMLALKAAVRKVIKEHKESGRPLVIWRDGKVVKIPASQI